MSNLRKLLFQPEPETKTPDKATEAAPSLPAQQKLQQSMTQGLSLAGAFLGRGPEGQRPAEEVRTRAYQELKSKIHNRLIDNLDIQALIQHDDAEPLEAAIER